MASNRSIEGWSGGGQAGYRVVFYRERDEALSYWYADTHAECAKRAADPEEPAARYWLKPYDEARDDSYRDAATQTGMYDAW